MNTTTATRCLLVLLSVATVLARAASEVNSGDGSRRHLQGYAWADQSQWAHGEKSKASVTPVYSDYVDVQGPFPAPAAGPVSGVDASIAAAPAPSGGGSKRHLLGLIWGEAARYGNKEMANTGFGDHVSQSAPTTAPAAAPLSLTGDGSRRHLQGYAWADQSQWAHGEKSKASVTPVYSDYVDVQGPFPAPAAGPVSGVDASIAAAPAPSASSWGNEDKDKADIQDIATETAAASV